MRPSRVSGGGEDGRHPAEPDRVPATALRDGDPSRWPMALLDTCGLRLHAEPSVRVIVPGGKSTDPPRGPCPRAHVRRPTPGAAGSRRPADVGGRSAQRCRGGHGRDNASRTIGTARLSATFLDATRSVGRRGSRRPTGLVILPVIHIDPSSSAGCPWSTRGPRPLPGSDHAAVWARLSRDPPRDQWELTAALPRTTANAATARPSAEQPLRRPEQRGRCR